MFLCVCGVCEEKRGKISLSRQTCKLQTPPRQHFVFAQTRTHTRTRAHAHPECSGKVVCVSWKMSVNVVEMCEIFLSIFVATDWHCVGIFAACPCFKWIRLRLRATSQGSLNLCGTGTVDDRSVGIGIGLPTTFSGSGSGSGNARATMTFPANGL